MTSKIDEKVQHLFKEILDKGKEYENKNRGVKRLQIPRYSLTHNFSDGFPAIACKELDFKAIVTELIWFLRGDNDIEFLRKHGVNIWNKDAYNWYVKECELNQGTPGTFKEFKTWGHGSVGQNYSKQWRNFNNEGVDQIKNLIEGMRKDIMSSRLLVEAWNPAQLDQTALPPCHKGFQVIGEDKSSFYLDWNQRSVDTFLG